MKRILMSALVALSISVSASADDGPFQWKNIGGDPCNPKVGCTLEWALANSEWPPEVQNALKEEARNAPPLTTKICSGWEGWMTWGKHKPKFRDTVVAEWDAGHCEFAAVWTTRQEAIQYNLIKVDECRNWGGWTESISTEAAHTIRLGKTPQVYCPPNEPGCTPCTGR